MLSFSDFVDDAPWPENEGTLGDCSIDDQIAGVMLKRLVTREDSRGDLTVLLSSQYGDFQPYPPHVYWVTAEAKSVRAWVYHKRQSDRLAYTNGDIRVVLFDLREDSPTYGKINVIDVGERNKMLIIIPPFVVHGVQNRGDTAASFVNMPTNVYDPRRPDKSRLPADHPGVPYRFV